MRIFALGLLVLFLPNTQAEYRAFELVITDANSGSERTTLSILDPLQYPKYYPLNLNESVKYTATWRCRGNTSHFRAICPKPERSQPEAPPQPRS